MHNRLHILDDGSTLVGLGMCGGVATLPVAGRTWRYPLITQKLNYAKLIDGQFHEWPSLPGFLTFFNSDTTGVKSPILDPSI